MEHESGRQPRLLIPLASSLILAGAGTMGSKTGGHAQTVL
jgi:hypothetical protein